MSEFDVIEAEVDPFEELESRSEEPVPEPIIIKGVGNMTVFGLSSRFDAEFPGRLKGRVAPEEFADTMGRVNGVLRKTMPINFRWLFCGCVFCCCTLGCSLWPVVCLNKRTQKALDKTLDWENSHLYNKVLLIDYLPKAPLLLPD